MSKEIKQLWDSVGPKRIKPTRLDVLLGIVVAVAGIMWVLGVF